MKALVIAGGAAIVAAALYVFLPRDGIELKQAIAAAPTTDVLGKALGTGACRSLCKKEPGRCLEVDSPESQEAKANPGEGLAKLFGRLSDLETSRIDKPTMLEYFGLLKDPCNRGATEVHNLPPQSGPHSVSRRIANTGDACRIGATVTLPSKRRMTASFLIPDSLELDYIIDDETKQLVIAPNPTKKPSLLVFSEASFQSDFGGIVELIEFGERESYIKTRTGCVWLRH